MWLTMMWGEPLGHSLRTDLRWVRVSRWCRLCTESSWGSWSVYSWFIDWGWNSPASLFCHGLPIFYCIVFYFYNPSLWLPLAFSIVARYLWDSGLCRVGWTLCSSNLRSCQHTCPSSGPDACRKDIVPPAVPSKELLLSLGLMSWALHRWLANSCVFPSSEA